MSFRKVRLCLFLALKMGAESPLCSGPPLTVSSLWGEESPRPRGHVFSELALSSSWNHILGAWHSLSRGPGACLLRAGHTSPQ